VRELRERFGRILLELRMDGAFFHPAIFDFLDGEEGRGIEYAIKVPMWKWLGLLPLIASRRRWTRVDDFVQGFETQLKIDQWDRTERVVVYRKRVSQKSRKNFQLDLFSSDDGHYEYSAVATNKALGVARRARSWKRTFDYVFQSVRRVRFELIQQPLQLVRPAGCPELHFAVSPVARSCIQRAERQLKRAA
jgi:hypothetical protein